MKYGVRVWSLGIIAGLMGVVWACSDDDPSEHGGQSPKNAIGFSTQMTESTDSELQGRSIINNGSTPGQALPSTGTLHVLAQEKGKTDYYIHDNLQDWSSAPAPYSDFKTPLQGTGKSFSSSYVWPDLNDMTFYAYYYKDSEASLSITDNRIIYTLADKVADQCDLLVADTMIRNSQNAENTGVPMNFRHTMSMVSFAFVKTIDEDVRLEKIQIVDYEKGEIDVAANVAHGQQGIEPDRTATKERIYAMATPIPAEDAAAATTTYHAETASLIFPDTLKTAQKVVTIHYRVYRNATEYDAYEVTDTLQTLGTTSDGRFEAGKSYFYKLKYTEKKVILEQKPIVKQWNSYAWANTYDNILDVWGNLGVEVEVYYKLSYNKTNSYSSTPKSATGGAFSIHAGTDEDKYKGRMVVPTESITEYTYNTSKSVTSIDFTEVPWNALRSLFGNNDYYKRTLEEDMCPWYRVVYQNDKWYAYGAPFCRYMSVELPGEPSYRSWFYSCKCMYYLYRWCEKDEGKKKSTTPTALRDINPDGTYKNYTADSAAATGDPTIKEGMPYRSTPNDNKVYQYIGDQDKIRRGNKGGQTEETKNYYNPDGGAVFTAVVWGEIPTAFTMINGTRTYMKKNLDGTGTNYLEVDVYRSKFKFNLDNDIADKYYNSEVEHIEWYVVNNSGGTNGAHADGIVCSDMSQAEWDIISDEN